MGDQWKCAGCGSTHSGVVCDDHMVCADCDEEQVEIERLREKLALTCGCVEREARDFPARAAFDEVERLKKRLAYAEANEQADCDGTQQCQGCHDCRPDYAKHVRLEIDRRVGALNRAALASRDIPDWRQAAADSQYNRHASIPLKGDE